MGAKKVKVPRHKIVINVYETNPENGAIEVVERQGTDKKFTRAVEASTYARAFNNNQKNYEGQVEKLNGVYPARMSRAIVEEI